MPNKAIKSSRPSIIIFCVIQCENGDYGRWEFGRSRKNFVATGHAILSGTN